MTIERVRLYDLARELGLSINDLMLLFKEKLNIILKSHSSTISIDDVKIIKDLLNKKGETIKKSIQAKQQQQQQRSKPLIINNNSQKEILKSLNKPYYISGDKYKAKPDNRPRQGTKLERIPGKKPKYNNKPKMENQTMKRDTKNEITLIMSLICQFIPNISEDLKKEKNDKTEGEVIKYFYSKEEVYFIVFFDNQSQMNDLVIALHFGQNHIMKDIELYNRLKENISDINKKINSDPVLEIINDKYSLSIKVSFETASKVAEKFMEFYNYLKPTLDGYYNETIKDKLVKDKVVKSNKKSFWLINFLGSQKEIDEIKKNNCLVQKIDDPFKSELKDIEKYCCISINKSLIAFVKISYTDKSFSEQYEDWVGHSYEHTTKIKFDWQIWNDGYKSNNLPFNLKKWDPKVIIEEIRKQHGVLKNNYIKRINENEFKKITVYKELSELQNFLFKDNQIKTEGFEVKEATQITQITHLDENKADETKNIHEPSLEEKEPTKPAKTNITEEELITHITRYIASKRYVFSEETIKNYHISMKTKPFVILSGLSGTGKTKLSQLYAEAISNFNNYFKIAVKPNWNDDRDLLGYFNPLDNKFYPSRLCNILKQANEDKNNLYFVCLDEMNLARVEYYFSEFLSAIEGDNESERKLYFYDQEILEENTFPKELPIPNNLFFTGTVNIDETTHPFSDKVLDRANTIEFYDVDHRAEAVNKELILSPISFNYENFENFKVKIPDKSKRSEIIEIYKILSKSYLGFGLRVRNEIELYLANSTNLLDKNDAFDIQIKQKILPKIKGNEDIKETLEEFNIYLKEKKYKRSVKKLEEMKKRLDNYGFTSFWR